MDSHTPEPLSTEQAKARLREKAERASPSNWLQQHPWNALGAAIAGGFVLSRMRFPLAAGTLLIQGLGPVLLGVVLRQVSKKIPPKKP